MGAARIISIESGQVADVSLFDSSDGTDHAQDIMAEYQQYDDDIQPQATDDGWIFLAASDDTLHWWQHWFLTEQRIWDAYESADDETKSVFNSTEHICYDFDDNQRESCKLLGIEY